MEQSKYNLITILGPTAGGKTSVATNLAYRNDGRLFLLIRGRCTGEWI